MTIVKVPNDILANTVTTLQVADLKDGTYRATIEKMRKEMVDHNGIGLAANQIGKDLALFVIDKELALEHGIPDAFANPDITSPSRDRGEFEEGCLSIPEYWAPIMRSKRITFKALDERGNKIKFKARGMLARVLQHETDHLNGLTIQDRNAEQKKKLRR